MSNVIQVVITNKIKNIMGDEKENRINKIAQVAKAMRDAEDNKRAESYERMCNFENKIGELANRISELIEVANEMIANGIQLGEFVGDWNVESPKFISDGIFHRFGFVVKGQVYKSSVTNHDPKIILIRGVGKCGGGCCGSDFIVDQEGIITSWNTDVYNKGIDDFLTKFDKFEKEFYEYVDSL